MRRSQTEADRIQRGFCYIDMPHLYSHPNLANETSKVQDPIVKDRPAGQLVAPLISNSLFWVRSQSLIHYFLEACGIIGNTRATKSWDEDEKINDVIAIMKSKFSSSMDEPPGLGPFNTPHTMQSFLFMFNHPYFRDRVKRIIGKAKPDQGHAIEEEDYRSVKLIGIAKYLLSVLDELYYKLTLLLPWSFFDLTAHHLPYLARKKRQVIQLLLFVIRRRHAPLRVHYHE
ncbi:hypothetical protein ACJ73_01407 [Blastomyces percursus]|uniref:Uncharacterized protein n=1 Tax=Blastomyces percursus TaxID=1658174 RepID=A0A1J9QGH7_9EURO|nr:hypothetical protein ACJ73_01407 [Blastomyces percursus]